MAEQQQSKWRLHSGQYLGEISALCFLHLPSHLSSLPYLLAGTGSQMLLYDLEEVKIVDSFKVFEGIRVHGITCGSIDITQGSSSTTIDFKVVIFGEKRVKLFNLHIGTAFKFQNKPKVFVDLALIHSVPKFSHWVLDVSFLKNYAKSKHEEGSHCLAIGCSDNSVSVWDISESRMILEVQSPEKCLLYSMRLSGDNVESLRIASGTIYNEIIIWKVVPLQDELPLTSVGGGMHLNNSSFSTCELYNRQHKAVHISRLIGHEGSIFRIVWSGDGSKLVSVSDDRSARIWAVKGEQEDSSKQEEETACIVLFGHSARVWDCCMFESLIVTAGEDCTCRVWGWNGEQLKMIKEHIGRGIWRCLYDPNSSLLITAGFDSAIKVHQLPASLPHSLEGQSERKQLIDRTKIFTSRLPNSSGHIGLTDSKSEYVRCLHFTSEDALYVATNNGYLYHAKLFETKGVKWTELAQVSERVPIICMDLLVRNFPKPLGIDDWIALGDGKGNMTVVRITGDVNAPTTDFTRTWSAGKERQLLGTYWCNTLGYRFIFTADPRGVLKLWRLHDPLLSTSQTYARTSDASLVAEFTSCFSTRIMCLDASPEDEVLVCGDLHGNLVLFSLSKSLLLDTPTAPEIKISPLCHFKGAHGISSISSISVSNLGSCEVEVRSTGADGCVCYFEFDRDQLSLEFVGMKQVKGLSLIQSVSANNNYPHDLANYGYAIGFASTDFIVWNLTTEAKVLQIPCGGWRRPHSYYLGSVAEMEASFAYVKDEMVYIHQQFVPESERRIFPQNLHIQFHGREMHSLCFVCENAPIQINGKDDLFDKTSWIATGCEDGTVRLTSYSPRVGSWSTSKLLGEHVGGSAVRSLCFVSKMHVFPSDVTNLIDWRNRNNVLDEDRQNPFLLISVGAKRVLTSWLLRDRRLDEKGNSFVEQELNKNGSGDVPCMDMSSSMSFKWLSTDMPAKNFSTHRTKNFGKIEGSTENVARMEHDGKSRSSSMQEKGETETKICLDDKDKDEDDWRYLAVTAFLVKCAGSRLTVCFIVVACSDATLALRALVLPHRLWFDVAVLVPLSSPVLALQLVIFPEHMPSGGDTLIGNVYIVISGATDGSIAFWDLTDSVESFMSQLSDLDEEKLLSTKTRPRTGRGSQGGRWWRSLSSKSKKKLSDGDPPEDEGRTNDAMSGTLASDPFSRETVSSHVVPDKPLQPEMKIANSRPEICEIQPLHVLNSIHQSGVNCLHVSVSDVQDPCSRDPSFFSSFVSGGDDQSLHYLKFDLSVLSTSRDSEITAPDVINVFTRSQSIKDSVYFSQCQDKKYRIRFLHHDTISSAHSSAVKGVWTDGRWVFSTGLDQRIRCWAVKDQSKMIEQTHVIVSVPEPEALCARACGRNRYEIAVAGRGMQMVEFLAS